MTELNHRRFVVAKLCDNDFGWIIEKALEDGEHNRGYNATTDIDVWRTHIIASVVAEILKRIDIRDPKLDWEGAKRIEEYLERNLDVSYQKFAPGDDHDGGSAAIQLGMDYAWTF